MKALCIAFILAAVTVMAGDVALVTDKGLRVLSGDEATQQQAHEKWVFERLQEAQASKLEPLTPNCPNIFGRMEELHPGINTGLI